jgi:hypothetical protein
LPARSEGWGSFFTFRQQHNVIMLRGRAAFVFAGCSFRESDSI